jgi:AcrR family transcriptional regulator
MVAKTVKPKQQRSIQSKEKILKAAEKIFAQKGLHGSRIDGIAKLSKVNKQRIYAYFGSKAKLYRQVLLNVYSQAANNERLTSLTEKDIPDMTAIILKAFFEFHEKHPFFWQLLAWENLNGGKSLSNQDWNNIQTSYITHLKNLYEKGQQKKIFRTDIEFGTYLLTLFSFTYFYHSNQVTISHLLNLKLKSTPIKEKITLQINHLITKGINA